MSGDGRHEAERRGLVGWSRRFGPFRVQVIAQPREHLEDPHVFHLWIDGEEMGLRDPTDGSFYPYPFLSIEEAVRKGREFVEHVQRPTRLTLPCPTCGHRFRCGEDDVMLTVTCGACRTKTLWALRRDGWEIQETTPPPPPPPRKEDR